MKGKEKIATILILLFTAAVLYKVFIAPQARELKALHSQYLSGVELVKIRHNKKGELEELRSNNQKVRKELSSLEDKLLKKEEVTSFLESLSKIATRTNNKLVAVEPKEREEPIGEGARTRFVKLNMIGRYSAITNFLGRLETHKKILKVSDITLKAARDDIPLETSFILTLYIIEDK